MLTWWKPGTHQSLNIRTPTMQSCRIKIFCAGNARNCIFHCFQRPIAEWTCTNCILETHSASPSQLRKMFIHNTMQKRKFLSWQPTKYYPPNQAQMWTSLSKQNSTPSPQTSVAIPPVNVDHRSCGVFSYVYPATSHKACKLRGHASQTLWATKLSHAQGRKRSFPGGQLA